MRITICILLGLLVGSCSRKNHPSVKSILLEQLRNTHTNEDWYVPLKTATQGLTAEQANWKDSTDNHSIGELVSHLIFWNERILAAFQGGIVPDFSGDNEETFKKFDTISWNQAVERLDSTQSKWYQSVDKATNEQLTKWASSVANVSSHNAYHTGQIIYIRKRNKWWNRPKAVK